MTREAAQKVQAQALADFNEQIQALSKKTAGPRGLSPKTIGDMKAGGSDAMRVFFAMLAQAGAFED